MISATSVLKNSVRLLVLWSLVCGPWSLSRAQSIHVVNGNVGIGTSTPQVTLQAMGAFYINSSSDATGGLYYGTAGNGLIIGKYSTSPWPGLNGLYVGGNTLLAGNVGIGTTSPSAKLHIFSGDSSFALFGPNASWNSFLVTGAGPSQVAAGKAQVISTNGNLHLDAGIGQNIYVAYYTSGNTFINPNGGNVGIGTTSPQFSLDVAGAVRFGGFNSADTDQWPNVVWLREGDWDEGLIKGSSSRNVFGRPGFGIHMAASKGFGFYSSGWDPLLNIEGGTGRLYVKGNVGIGTTNPLRALQVNGELSVTRSDKIAFVNVSDPAGNGGGTIWLRGLTSNGSAGTDATILLQGNVGIGTTSPTHKLTVNGQVKAKGFLADTSNWADFVFEPDYPLAPLPEVEAHIREKGHLPGIPSATEVREQGVDLMAMQVKLLQKIEELTLYTIELRKENATARRAIQQLTERLTALEQSR